MRDFYQGKRKREADEDREVRFEALEDWANSVKSDVLALVRQATATTESRFPQDLIVDGPGEDASLSLESEATDLDPSTTYQEIDTTPGPQARRLPAANVATGPLFVKNVGPNSLYLYPQVGELIDEEPVVVLPRQWSAVQFVSTGAEWRIYSVYLPQERLAPTLAAVLLVLQKLELHLASLSGETVTDADASGEE